MAIHNQILEAVERLKKGEVVAYPTETFFGLGIDPNNEAAVERLLKLKDRFLGEGISLIAADLDAVNKLKIKDFNLEQRVKLQNKFWPGPLTLVVELKEVTISKKLLANNGSIALRVSSGLIATELAKGIGGLITATSANFHGEAPAKTSSEVRTYFPEIFVLEQEPARANQNTKPSTILSLLKSPFEVLREGAISLTELSPYL